MTSWTDGFRRGLIGSEIDCTAELPEDHEPFAVGLLFFCFLHVVTCLWRRLVVPYQRFPWRLVRLIDPRLDDEEKHSTAVEFLRAPTCCLDFGFSDRLRSQANTIEKLLGRWLPVIQSISINKVVNSEIENNFARAVSAARCARGQIFVHLPWSPILGMYDSVCFGLR